MGHLKSCVLYINIRGFKSMDNAKNKKQTQMDGVIESFILKAKVIGLKIEAVNNNGIIITKNIATNKFGIFSASTGLYTGEIYLDYKISNYFFIGFTTAESFKQYKEGNLYILPKMERLFKRAKFIEADFVDNGKVAGVWLPKSKQWYLVNNQGKIVEYTHAVFGIPRIRKLGYDLYIVNNLYCYNENLEPKKIDVPI